MRPETQALLDHAAANGGEIDNIHDHPVEAVGEAHALGLLDWPADDAMELAVRVKPLPSHTVTVTDAQSGEQRRVPLTPSHVQSGFPGEQAVLRAPTSGERLKGMSQSLIDWIAAQPLAKAVEQTLGSQSPIAQLRDAYREPGGLETLSYNPANVIAAMSVADGAALKMTDFPAAARPSQVYKQIVAHGGYTVHPTTGAVVAPGVDGPTMVGKFPNALGRTLIVPRAQFSPDTVKKFYRVNQDVFAADPTAYMGGWIDSETHMVHLDVSVGRDDARKAVKFAEFSNPGTTRGGKPTGVVRTPDGSWPQAQRAVWSPLTGDTPVGNLSEFVQSPEFQSRLHLMAQTGRELMKEANWWDLHGGPVERVYGKEGIEPMAGYIAASSPQNATDVNARIASEYMRRHLAGEPPVQPKWTAPKTTVGLEEGGPRRGRPMPMAATHGPNVERVRAGHGDTLHWDKVNDMRRALMGDKDVAVIDRHYAKLAEAPERGIFTDTIPNRVPGSMERGQRSPYADIENAVRTAAQQAGVSVADYSAWVWEGIRHTIKHSGKLFWQAHRASAIPDTVGGFNGIIEQMIAEKAKALKVPQAKFEQMLRAGHADLLSAVLATAMAAEAAASAPAAPPASPIPPGGE